MNSVTHKFEWQQKSETGVQLGQVRSHAMNLGIVDFAVGLQWTAVPVCISHSGKVEIGNGLVIRFHPQVVEIIWAHLWWAEVNLFTS